VEAAARFLRRHAGALIVAALFLGYAMSRQPTPTRQAPAVSLEKRRTIFAELALAEPDLREQAQLHWPRWPYGADDHFHGLEGHLWGRLARNHRVDVEQVMLIADEGLRAGWAEGLPVKSERLAPTNPDMRLRGSTTP
jgi:hypothetical protein